MKVVALISGGRDSTAMLLKYLDEGNAVDYIVFNNTQHEFDIMYEYLVKLQDYLYQNYKKTIYITEPNSTFESWVFGKTKKGKNKGNIRGLPKTLDPCFWRRESKVYPTDRLMKTLGLTKDKCVQLLGYTASEKDRVQINGNFKYPLIDWNWCEGDVDKYLESIGMVNPLYKYFSRTGCAFCPYMSLRSYYIVWKFFKKTWLYMKKIERKLRHIERLDSKVVNTNWNINYTLLELENDFISGKKDYDDTPAKDCVCAI